MSINPPRHDVEPKGDLPANNLPRYKDHESTTAELAPLMLRYLLALNTAARARRLALRSGRMAQKQSNSRG